MSGALLLLMLCLPAWGEKAPAQPAAPAEDAGRQGSVEPKDDTPSARELRRMRRAERRALRRAAQRAAGKTEASGTGSSEAEEDGEEAPPLEKSGSAAVQKAMDLGQGFQGAAKDPGDMGLPDVGKDLKPLRGPPADPSRPRTEKEFVIAVQSGYKASPAAVGLVLARDPSGAAAIKRADGAPPAKADLAALRRHIEAEPRALMRRPDFFEVLPRPRYQELKADYRAKPELKASAFQDVGLTAAERDFVWERSCDKVSGDCNPNAGAGSYKKDAEVAPEDLDSIWKQIYGTADTFLQAVVGSPRGAPDAPPGAVSASFLGRLRGRISTWGAWLTGTDPGDDSASPEAGAFAAAGMESKEAPGAVRSMSSVRDARKTRQTRGLRRQAGTAGTGLLAALAALWLWRRRGS
jgi:hypothetical protein